ncbi:MAG TPA: 4-hydroxy-tetrahydrodipicolinate reductase [Spirochaetia bacterium]|nr:4-hydroxy-tetrahydrodipicolinate reductase [Spirochaetia bacterium]
MIRIGLVGFGKTGKDVARELISDKSVKLVCVFKYSDTAAVGKDTGLLLGMEPAGVRISLLNDYDAVLARTKPDVMIDFAAKRSILHYLEPTARQRVNLVICSTGYNETQLEMIKKYSTEIGILWAPNITDGINILAKISTIVKKEWPDADISIIETHHAGKKGMSGTAYKIAEAIRDTEDIRVGRVRESAREENEIIIHKVRLGGVIGRHEVIFGTPYQTITMTHNTISRRAFGRGAIRAAHWIHGKKGFFTVEDIIR